MQELPSRHKKSLMLYIKTVLKKHLSLSLILIPILLHADETDSLRKVFKNPNIHDSLKIRAISDLAWNYLSFNPDSGYILAELELDLAKKYHKRNLIIDAYNTMGTAQRLKGNYLKALDCYQKCLVIQEKNKDTLGLGSTYNNMGVIYQYQDEYKKALGLHLKGLVEYSKAKNKLGIAKSYSNLGIVYQDMKEYKKSISCHLYSMKSFRELNKTSSLSKSYNNLGTVYYMIKNYSKALYYFDESMKIQRAEGDINGVAASLANVGEIRVIEGKFKEAVSLCKEGLTLSETNNFADDIKTSCHCLYLAYRGMKDDKNALIHLEKYNEISDSLKNSSLLDKLNRQELEFEYQNKTFADSIKISEERKVVAAQLKVEKTKRNALYGGIALLLGFGFFVYNRLTVTRRQKSTIEKQKLEVELQKNMVEEKNKEIIDSIGYAKRLQLAILPPISYFETHFKNFFVLYKPKDIVAGDFYWLEKTEDYLFVAAADCTGHGVPGALVSVVCSNALNRIVKEFKLTDTGKILDKASLLIMETFEKSGDVVKDGMDISLLRISLKTKGEHSEIQWSGANNPLWYILPTSNQLSEIRGNKMPVGNHVIKDVFTSHSLSIPKNTCIYLITDGFADQFGGEDGKKLMSKKLKSVLLNLTNEKMEEQQKQLSQYFTDWRGNRKQIDDVTVIGLKI